MMIGCGKAHSGFPIRKCPGVRASNTSPFDAVMGAKGLNLCQYCCELLIVQLDCPNNFPEMQLHAFYCKMWEVFWNELPFNQLLGTVVSEGLLSLVLID